MGPGDVVVVVAVGVVGVVVVGAVEVVEVVVVLVEVVVVGDVVVVSVSVLVAAKGRCAAAARAVATPRAATTPPSRRSQIARRIVAECRSSYLFAPTERLDQGMETCRDRPSRDGVPANGRGLSAPALLPIFSTTRNSSSVSTDERLFMSRD